ncbi:unnamed protein product [Orchesella dallaii]|uniref:Reverse transcriptase domain-containing protein n=1 Tax=Orchesella dallaii TaxID=48710 RepID=A0ABP1RW30_9HEXA
MICYDKIKFAMEEILELHNNWILCRLKGNNAQMITIGCTYVPPQPEYNALIKEFAECLENYATTHPDLIIGGDFNARVADKTMLPYGNSSSASLTVARNSTDGIINARGKLLINYFTDLGLSLLNGRSSSDPKGDLTYVRSNGGSVVDLIWVPAHMLQRIHDFAVEEISASDHQPVAALVDWYTPGAVTHGKDRRQIKLAVQKFRWIPERATEFRQILSETSLNNDTENTAGSLYAVITDAIGSAANATNMTYTVRPMREPRTKNKPWFDAECSVAKKDMRRSLRRCKKHGYRENYLREYLKRRKHYEITIASKKKVYNELIRDKLSASSDPKEFWETVTRLRGSARHDCPISKTSWEAFYKDVLPSRELDKTEYIGVLDPDLDREISMAEIMGALKKLKLNKSPGLDGIRNEVLKSLPTHWLEVVMQLFNRIQANECFPEEMTDIEVVMLYKKGDPANPRNYRGISLINTILKLFSSIMLARLEKWAESSGVIPESQAGFRKKRGCADHIFTIEAIRQISRHRMKKRKLHLLFVDFARAFDSINHKKLWMRLNDVGVSAKFVRIFRDLYSKAAMRVRTREGASKRFDVAEGVLQGELTSPLFFALFISDIDDVFSALQSNGIRGLNINHNTSLHVLAYADDLVILADCPTHLQTKLDALSQYCQEKGLAVNVAKTKILVFNHCHSQQTSGLSFTYQSEPVEVVQEFTYLGITFCTCGKFHKHLNNIKAKCASVTGTIVSVILRSRTHDWGTVEKLLNALLMSIPLYAGEIWALEYAQEIEKLQLNLLKRVLTLPQCTPGYMIRVETGTRQIISTILKRALGWWAKVSHMPITRLPKICMNELAKLPTDTYQSNWLNSTYDILRRCGAGDTLDLQDMSTEGQNKAIGLALSTTRNYLMEEDLARLTNYSEFSSTYGRMKHNCNREMYLTYPISFHKKRIFAQLRLHGDRLPFLNVYANRVKNSFSPTKYCSICNANDNDDLFHVFCRCIVYEPLRLERSSITKHKVPDRRSFLKIFKKYDCEDVHQICSFVRASMYRRNSYLDEAV